MNFYVPEIGDHIRLIEDWSFVLHPEQRNDALAAFFGYYPKGWNNSWLKEDEHPPMPSFDYSKIKYPSPYSREANLKAENECVEYQQWKAANEKWQIRADELCIKELNITLPAGTVLAVDRIYIRKGVSDYSSITFFAKGLGETEVRRGWHGDRKQKVKSMRFWAKLEDCNKISFEKCEKIS